MTKDISLILKNQKEFFKSGATRDVQKRIEKLRLLYRGFFETHKVLRNCV